MKYDLIIMGLHTGNIYERAGYSENQIEPIEQQPETFQILSKVACSEGEAHAK